MGRGPSRVAPRADTGQVWAAGSDGHPSGSAELVCWLDAVIYIL